MRLLSIVAVLLALQGPAISVSPASGQPGSQFVVSGSGFESGERVKVFWDGTNLGGTVKVDVDGTFRYSGVVPGGAAPGGHTIAAAAIGGATSKAQTSFTVTTPPTTTTSTVTSTTSPSATSTTSAGAVSPTSAPATTATTVASAVGSQPNPTAPPATDGSQSTVPDTVVGPDGEEAEPPAVGSGSTSPIADPSPTEAPLPAAGSQPDDSSSAVDGKGIAGLMVVMVVMVVLGSVAGVTLLLWGRSKKSEESEADQSPIAQTPVLAPMSAADVYIRDGEWVRHMMDLSPLGEITDLVTGSAGLVGLGRTADTSGKEEAAVWTSDDGVVWQGAVTLGAFGAVVAVPWQGGVMVTISREHGGQMSSSSWRSEDGQTWEQLLDSDDSALAGISLEGGTALDDVVVAWGRDKDAPGVWFSRDGANWQRSALRGGFDLIGRAGGALLAFGRDSTERLPLIARSLDGISWQELEDRQSRSVFTGASVAALASFQDGMVVAGTDVTLGSGAVWVSDDGTRWLRVPFEPGPATSIDSLLNIGDRLIAIGTDTARSRGGRGTPIIWESSDAVSWKQVSVPRILSNAVVNSISYSDESILICGILIDERDGAGLDSIPISWRWNPSRDPEPESNQDRNPTDLPAEEDLELALGATTHRM